MTVPLPRITMLTGRAAPAEKDERFTIRIPRKSADLRDVRARQLQLINTELRREHGFTESGGFRGACGLSAGHVLFFCFTTTEAPGHISVFAQLPVEDKS